MTLQARSRANDEALLQQSLDKAIETIEGIILGKRDAIRLAVSCLLAQGHLLIEDQPGVGKTTLAHALAKALGLEFSRIQFTSDLLPADVLGAAIYSREEERFHFHPGPVFAHCVLADEINRATPKTQSALLEAMAEQQVSIDGETHKLPQPFFVIATQNPATQVGTYPLPESQLDRFMMRLHLGYPGREAERALLTGADRRQQLQQLKAALSPEAISRLQQAVHEVHVSDAIVDYVQAIIDFSRNSPHFHTGLSPRAGLALLQAARALALVEHQRWVLPEQVQAVLPAVVNHRLPMRHNAGPGETPGAAGANATGEPGDAAQCILQAIPVDT